MQPAQKKYKLLDDTAWERDEEQHRILAEQRKVLSEQRTVLLEQRKVLLDEVIEYLDTALCPSLVNIIAEFSATHYVIDARDVWQVVNIKETKSVRFCSLSVEYQENAFHELRFYFMVHFSTYLADVDIWISLQDWTMECHVPMACQNSIYSESDAASRANEGLKENDEFWDRAWAPIVRKYYEEAQESLVIEPMHKTSKFIFQDLNEFGVLIAKLPRFALLVSQEPCIISCDTLMGHETQSTAIAHALASLQFATSGLCLAHGIPPRTPRT